MGPLLLSRCIVHEFTSYVKSSLSESNEVGGGLTAEGAEDAERNRGCVGVAGRGGGFGRMGECTAEGAEGAENGTVAPFFGRSFRPRNST